MAHIWTFRSQINSGLEQKGGGIELFWKWISCWDVLTSKEVQDKKRHGRKVRPSPGTPGPPRYLKIPWTTGTPRTSGFLDPLGPQDTYEITSTVWNSESKRSKTLKLSHKQWAFLNYMIGQAKGRIACTFWVFWGYFIYWDFIYLTTIIRGQSPTLLRSSNVIVISRNDNEA